MKFSRYIPALLAATLPGINIASAANSFAGSNLYYAAGLTTAQRTTLLSGLQSAGMKVLRVWLDGQSGSPKGTPINAFPSLEPNVIGTFDDTVLDLLDEFMIDAQAHGIKLIVSMHSFNALQAGDVYGALYGTGFFYEQTTPQQQFDNRLVHVLNHVHTSLGKPWKELSEYIFGFEAENEAMIGKGQDYIEAHQQWQCDRANTIKGQLGNNSGILVVTGGESWMSESVQPQFLTCAAIDVVSIHGYGVGDFDTGSIQTYVQQAQSAGKKLLYEEWGACYFDTENNNCPTGDPLPASTRNANIETWASQITASGVPWLYWQVIPQGDPHGGADFEIGVVDDPSWTTLQSAALAALQAPAAFDFSEWLP